MRVCPQCDHPEHPPAKETPAGKGSAFEGGCPAMVYLEPLPKGGYYHEHCDCDYSAEVTA